MPKQSPLPEELDKPFWDACTEDRLVIQNCTAYNTLRHPSQPACGQCASANNLEWQEVNGRGRIYGYE